MNLLFIMQITTYINIAAKYFIFTEIDKIYKFIHCCNMYYDHFNVMLWLLSAGGKTRRGDGDEVNQNSCHSAAD